MNVLILGASSGFGEAFARQLALQNHNLILCALDESGLVRVQKSIESKHGVAIEIFQADLTEKKSLDELFQRYSYVDMVINSAGIGHIGDFEQISMEDELRTINLNVLTMHAITKHFALAMSKQKKGGIINVASTASYIPMPNFGIYAATKAFALSYTMAISKEVEKDGVRIMALCPGPTETSFLPKEQYNKIRKKLYHLPLLMSPDQIVVQTLKRYQRNDRVFIPGRLNRCINTLDRFIPIEWILDSVYNLYGYIKRA